MQAIISSQLIERDVDLADLGRRRCAGRAPGGCSRAAPPGWVSENAPEISAWDAMTVAIVARHDQRDTAPSRGPSGRRGSRWPPGRAISSAPCPKYTSTRLGSTSPYQPRAIGRRPKWPMSAYSASPPTTTRMTAPSARKPLKPLSAKNSTAWPGCTARSTPGCCDDLRRAEHGEGREPHDHDRAEDPPDRRRCPGVWTTNRRDEDDDGQRARRSGRGSGRRPSCPRRRRAPRWPG